MYRYPGVAQLVGRLVWDQDAASSSLATRTIKAESAFALSAFIFCMVRLESSNAARMSAAGEDLTEPNLYLRPTAQIETSLATRSKNQNLQLQILAFSLFMSGVRFCSLTSVPANSAESYYGRFSSQPGQAAQHSSSWKTSGCAFLFCRITPVYCGTGRCGMRRNLLTSLFMHGLQKPVTTSTRRNTTWIFCAPGVPLNAQKSFSSRWRTANWTGREED